MAGYGDGSFCPETNISNAEICFILARLFGSMSDKNDRDSFYKNSWAESYIAWIQDKLSKESRELWFDERTIDSSVSCEKADELFRYFFGRLIKHAEIPNESNVDLTGTGNATRLQIAKGIFHSCVSFFHQVESYNVEELLQFWKPSFVNPYRLLLNIYATGMVRLQKQNRVLYKLTCLESVKPEEAPDIYKELNNIDSIEEEYKKKFVPYKGKACHYTTVDALVQMLTKSKEILTNGNIGLKMFMGNAEYLNDPQEGQYFDEVMGDIIQQTDRVLKPKDTYVLSLSLDEEERLPMWVQYGGNGMGCRIEFEINDSDNFLQVAYIKPDDQLVTRENESIQKLKNYIAAHTEKVIRKYARDVIEKIKYYVKPSYYDYEKEIRYCVTCLPQLAKAYQSPRPGESVPRLYCELNKALKVTSITLGPKCPNPNYIALFLYRCGIPEVCISSIKFK